MSMKWTGLTAQLGVSEWSPWVLRFGFSEAMHLFARERLLAKHTGCANHCESYVSEMV
jgi:hypothetical protein